MSEHGESTGIAFEVRGSVVIASILNSGVVEPSGVEDFGNNVIAYLENNPGANILISFQQVDYMSSSAVTQIIRIKETCDRLKTHMALFGLRKEMMQIFEITNLTEHLHAMDEQDEGKAVKKFQRFIQREAEDSAWNDS